MSPKLTAAVPAGTYWVGDPCYSVPDGDWMAWLEAADYTEVSRSHVLYAELTPDKIALGVSTIYGDGVYYDKTGRSYGVDAGLIGLVSTTWPGSEGLTEKEGIRYLLTLTEPLEVTAVVDGWIELGSVEIEVEDSTEGEPEDEDEEPTYECPRCGDGHEGESGTELCVSCQEDEDLDEADDDE